jgi:hypothetical protein
MFICNTRYFSTKEGKKSKFNEKPKKPEYKAKMFHYSNTVPHTRYLCSEQSPEIPQMKLC